ncbi:hypothetical protein S40293_02247 [Stachybotrys chartarum IBT 40293]|nr:hypothetical protein S40293_02247 [Stachybotrys chartarum IBT 40293]
MSPIPSTQTAIVEDDTGRPTLVRDAPVPALRPGMLLVRTVAVALNPSDYKMGLAFPSAGAVIGMDFAGHVVAVDAEAAALRPDVQLGDAVCGIVHGSNPGDHEGGAFGEHVLVYSHLVLKVPEGLELERAATLGCALLTSCVALWGALRIVPTPETPAQESEKAPVLVYGGSTSCGTVAIQLLKLSGLDPIATCSPKNFGLVKSYGASACFDYSTPGVAQAIKTHTKGRLRHAIDCISDQASTACCYASLGRPGGRYASLEVVPAEWKTREAVKHEFIMCLEGMGREAKLDGEYGRPASQEKRDLAAKMFAIYQSLLTDGKLQTHPMEVVGKGFEGILDGLAKLKSGSVSGRKLVVSLA